MLVAPDRPNYSRNPTGKGGFVKGQSGNPQGRPRRGQTTAELLRAIGDRSYRGRGSTYREQAARALWEKAATGDLHAFAWITERTEGKVPDVLQTFKALADTSLPLSLRLGLDDEDALTKTGLVALVSALLPALLQGVLPPGVQVAAASDDAAGEAAPLALGGNLQNRSDQASFSSPRPAPETS